MLPGLIPTPPTGGAPTPARMRQAAEGFEAQVLAQLLQPAFAAASAANSPFGGGSAEAQWQPMLLDAFAASAARGGRGIGLADMVLAQMIRAQEAAQQPNPTPTPAETE
jgi:peptidoglycan hydrolase FlgJ